MQATTPKVFFDIHEDEIKTILLNFREVEEACIDFSDAQRPKLYLKSQHDGSGWVGNLRESLKQLYEKNGEEFNLFIKVAPIPVSAASILFYVAQASYYGSSAAVNPLSSLQPEELILPNITLSASHSQGIDIQANDTAHRIQVVVSYFAKIKQANGKSQEIMNEIEELNLCYQDKKKLPSKIDLSEEANKKYDIHRLQYINKALSLLAHYWVCEEATVVGLTPEEAEAAENLKLLNARRLLEHVAFTTFHISGELRAKYKFFLKPTPFTWETFEQLGGAMKIANPTWQNILIKNMPAEVAGRLLDEFNNSELITEAAIPSIVEADVPQLIMFFNYIYGCETSAAEPPAEFTAVNLSAIKAFTRRIIDTETLIKLLKYTDSEFPPVNQTEIVRALKQMDSGQRYMLQSDSDEPSRHFNLDSLLGRHAALHRLERIGELITGKNFSSFLQRLDSTIDWQALVRIRDTIAHQEIADNKIKVDTLLADNVRFLFILREQMQEFFMRLNQIVVQRDQNLPQFKKDIEVFWQEVYAYEKSTQEKKEEGVEDDSFQVRVSEEELAIFMRTLQLPAIVKEINRVQKECGLQNIYMQWLGILNGQQDIPSKKDIGILFTIFSPLNTTTDKPLYKQCQAIRDKATKHKPNKPTREEQQLLAEKRKAEKEQNFKGLEGLRRLSQEFVTHAFPNLTEQGKVSAAIVALENIKKFMEDDEFVQANFNFPDVKAWEEEQTPETIGNFFARFVSFPEFNDAIGYNAAQLLQYIDTIRHYPEAHGYSFLHQGNETLRFLRNHVVHGNPLFDKQEYDPDPAKEESLLNFIQKKLGPIMITLIFELLPILKAIETKLTPTSAAVAAAGV